MNRWLQILIFFCFLSTSIDGVGFNKQKKIEKFLNEAEVEMLHGNFSKCLELLESAKKINELNPDIYSLQIEIGELTQQSDLLIDANQMLIKIYPEKTSFKLVLAALFIDAGRYQKAQALLTSFESNTKEYKRLIASCNFALEQLKKQPDTHFELRRLNNSINTNENEYWPSYSNFDSILYFTRLTNLGAHFNTERIFYIEENNCYDCVEQLQLNQNPNISEGNISISVGGNLLFLTICGGTNGKGSCDIYYSIKQDSLWTKPQKAPFPVSTRFWESQPFLSFDGSKLYFVSNRTGGFGGMDIYQCEVRYLGPHIQFIDAKNIGQAINTEFDEFSPYLSADKSRFYFSSNGHIGMGGSDLYKASYSKQKYTNISNLGFPFNTHFDEGGFTARVDENLIYFHSNRPIDSIYSKNIYQLIIPKEESSNKYLVGKLFDRNTNKCIGAEIEFNWPSSDSIWWSNANELTGYRTIIPKSNWVKVRILKSGFQPFLKELRLEEESNSTIQTINFFLEPLAVGESFVIEDLLFRFDSAELMPSAALQLTNLLAFLKANPSIKIEIIGHTDEQGSKAYNQNLSELRANSIFMFLIESIEKDRIKYSGKGASEPIASNKTEAGRAQNRRTEIKILDLNYSKDQ